MYLARDSVIITNANGTNSRATAIYIGVSDDYDVTFDGTNWIEYKQMVAGTIYPMRVVGIRHAADSSAPDSGDVIFLYSRGKA